MRTILSRLLQMSSAHLSAGEGGFGAGGDGWDDDVRGDPLDLTEPLGDEDAPKDELELGADQVSDEADSPLASKPRKHQALSGGDGSASGGAGGIPVQAGAGGAAAAGVAAQGSTLFERMANLSRGSSNRSDDDDSDDDEDEGGSSLNIPRFLGRQNNQ